MEIIRESSEFIPVFPTQQPSFGVDFRGIMVRVLSREQKNLTKSVIFCHLAV